MVGSDAGHGRDYAVDGLAHTIRIGRLRRVELAGVKA